MSEYYSRDSRHAFIAKKFSNYLNESVLNIGGGGKKHLLKYIKPDKYTEIDISGNPDLLIDLDSQHPIPFEDNHFETIICTEVLEHLEEFHRVFSELVRISKKHIIISLPNAWRGFSALKKQIIYNGKDGRAGIDVGKYRKFYGLPLNKPLDRHRWFFSYSEAEEFFKLKSSELPYKIIEQFPTGIGSNSLRSRLQKIIYKPFISSTVYKDWFYKTYWCVLEKK